MVRRAHYMYGALLARGPTGQVDAGLGKTNSTGTVSLIPPTMAVTRTGQEIEIDGVELVFQITPGAEAPAEMNFYFPQRRLLCSAENTTHNMHNIVTLRGARSDTPAVVVARPRRDDRAVRPTHRRAVRQHHWPTWGTDDVVEFLGLQRDLYRYPPRSDDAAR